MVGFSSCLGNAESGSRKLKSYPRISPPHKEAIKEIWKKCGRMPFLWNYISAELNNSRGIMRTLLSSGVTEDAGYGSPTGCTRLWKLKSITAQQMEEELGPVSGLIERKCEIHNALWWDHCEKLQRAHQEKQRSDSNFKRAESERAKRKRAADKMVRETVLSSEDATALISVYDMLMELPMKSPRAVFTYARVLELGIITKPRDLPRLSYSGWVKVGGKVASNNCRKWALTEKTIETIEQTRKQAVQE